MRQFAVTKNTVVDHELAQGVHGKIRLQQRFSTAYEQLPEEPQARTNHAVGDCLLEVKQEGIRTRTVRRRTRTKDYSRKVMEPAPTRCPKRASTRC